MYCQESDLPEYLLQGYLDRAEDLHPGIRAKAVASANARVDDALRGSFVLPLETVPDTLRQIAAALAAHHVVGAITTLLNETDFQFLLDQVRQARAALARIVDGRDDIGLERLGAEPTEPGGALVDAPARIFTGDSWERF